MSDKPQFSPEVIKEGERLMELFNGISIVKYRKVECAIILCDELISKSIVDLNNFYMAVSQHTYLLSKQFLSEVKTYLEGKT